METATTELYTLSLHDALPILNQLMVSTSCARMRDRRRHTSLDASRPQARATTSGGWLAAMSARTCSTARSEEHTSELQSHSDLVCRLLLEKKNLHIFGMKYIA